MRACELDGELVLLDLVRGEYFGLGEVGSEMWRALAGGRAVSEIATQLASLYDVEKVTIERDLLVFARELQDAGLLVAAAS